MANTDKRTRALIRASGFYLTAHLTKELLDGDDDVLDEFISQNLWEPFEYWSANSVYKEISGLADSFEELMV